MGVYLGSSGREIRASCDRWHSLALIILSPDGSPQLFHYNYKRFN